MWTQRFYRNPNRKPFQWNFNTGCEEEGEGRLETLEASLETREEDMDRLNDRISSDNDETDPSDDDLSILDSEREPKTEDILKDVSQLFNDEIDENNQPVAPKEVDCR